MNVPWWQRLAVLAASVLAAALLVNLAMSPRPHAEPTRYRIGEAKALEPGLELTFGEPRTGAVWHAGKSRSSTRTADVYLVLPVTLVHSAGDTSGTQFRLRAKDGRTYDGLDHVLFVPRAGARCLGSVVFLLPWDALEGAEVTFDQGLVASFYDRGGVLDLGLTPERVAAMEPRRGDEVVADSCFETEAPL